MTKRERPAVTEDHGHDLPGLIDWGDELLSATARAERERVTRARRRWRRRAIPAVAAVAVLLVPGAVVATRTIWDDPVGRVGPDAGAGATAAVRLVDGRAGDVYWRVAGWNSGDRVCLRTEAWRGDRRVLSATGCDAPRTDAKLTAMLSDPGGLAIVAGAAAPTVATVRVQPPAGAGVRVAAVPVPAENLRRSGLRDVARIYVALFPRGFGGRPLPPVVEAFDEQGASLGTLGEATR